MLHTTQQILNEINSLLAAKNSEQLKDYTITVLTDIKSFIEMNKDTFVVQLDALTIVQEEHKKWKQHNFGEIEKWEPVFGMIEELGELAHTILKDKQRVREMDTNFRERISDAIGDLMIFTISFCNEYRLDACQVLNKTWNLVKKRDWKKYPKTGIDIANEMANTIENFFKTGV